MPPTINIEWLNQNSLRNYPFKEDVKLCPTTSSGVAITDVRIPNYLLVDFVLVSPNSFTDRVYLSRLVYVGTTLTLIFSDSNAVQISSVSVDTDSHLRYAGYNIVGSGIYDDVRGRVVLGDLTRLSDDLPNGNYLFALALSEFEPSTIRPTLRGVRSLQLSNQGTESAYIYGHVKLLAGSNVKLTYLSEYNAIRIDAIYGEGLNEDCDCEDAIGTNNIVKTINGIPVEDAVIAGDGQCVDVSVSGNQIIISDICSTPCCGCPELEFLTESLKVLDATVNNLESYANQLAERISNFVNSFVLTVGAGHG